MMLNRANTLVQYMFSDKTKRHLTREPGSCDPGFLFSDFDSHAGRSALYHILRDFNKAYEESIEIPKTVWRSVSQIQ